MSPRLFILIEIRIERIERRFACDLSSLTMTHRDNVWP
uniref:Uncharacterized protein n=1 Tax=uncultured bacterium A1Q1_fos_1815 TaxID=1256553 RepID=L7VR28_9BACT|nr:hypothetical protein [uncultured bacterium A1Q1_fos_1815]